MRVFVAQLVKTERATLRDLDRAFDGFSNRGVTTGNFLERTQVLLGVWKESRPCFGQRALLADARQHVLQITPLGDVVMHVVGGDERDAGALGQFGELRESDFVGQVAGQLDGEVEAVAEDFAVGEEGIEALRG